MTLIGNAANFIQIMTFHSYCFDRINADNVVRTTDNADYPEPTLICMQLTHKDVVLGYFASRRRELDALISGQELIVGEDGCFAGDKQVLKYSAKFRAQIAQLGEKGYAPIRASVRHVVFWQGKDMDNEVKIVLPNVEFFKDGRG